MPVIINDFEIMVDRSEQTGGTAPKPSPQGNQLKQPSELQPQDIERMIRHFEERRCRLIAD